MATKRQPDAPAPGTPTVSTTVLIPAEIRERTLRNLGKRQAESGERSSLTEAVVEGLKLWNAKEER